MRTIRNLIIENKKVYIFLEDEKARENFAIECEKEGISFSDKVSAKERKMQDVMALLPDSALCYLGTAGRMCFKYGGDSAVRIDYKKYVEGNKDYIIDPKKI